MPKGMHLQSWNVSIVRFQDSCYIFCSPRQRRVAAAILSAAWGEDVRLGPNEGVDIHLAFELAIADSH
ncbi:MAG TPA: hypothetical protein VJ983_03065 [candidate division Zixibacteria bacterium]|nr:hypothetical protein [candidate division Zixibacteria bacterium]